MLGRILTVEPLVASWSVAVVAVAAGVTTKTVREGCERFAAEREPGLRGRSSRSHRSPARRPAASEAEIEAPPRQHRSGRAVAGQLGLPLPTVEAVLCRRGLGRLSARDTPREVQRDERERLG